jgi:phospholipase C
MTKDIRDKIKHVVVLMLENRSFDHIMGDFPGVDGIKNATDNLLNPGSAESLPSNPGYPPYPIDVDTQPLGAGFDPDHSFAGMMIDLFGPGTSGCFSAGSPPKPQPSPTPPTYNPQQNCGFVNRNNFEGTVSGATNASPIVVTTMQSPPTGSVVTISGVIGNTAANNTAANPAWTVTHIDATTFSLDNSQGNGTYTGGGTWTWAPVMSYFRYVAAAKFGHPQESGRLKVLHGLAEEFCLCEKWFCDVPCCTIPNRMFVHAATTQGYMGPNYGYQPTYTAESIYEKLSHHGRDWAMYYYAPGDERDTIMYQNIAGLPQAQLPIESFPADVAAGKLPFYTFIMPSLMASGPQAKGNSMHPNADVRWGENLVAETYNCLRNSRFWENTLLVITFDENGGIYDHVPPPPTVNPDGINYYTTWPIEFSKQGRYTTFELKGSNGNAPYAGGGTWTLGGLPVAGRPSGSVTGATQKSPIVITTATALPATATQVTIFGVQGNTNANSEVFDYTLLGPRIPVILVSPWLDRGIDRTEHYQNTSILRFVQDLVDPLSTIHLNERDRNAKSFAHLFTRESPRTDCPASIDGYGDQFNWGGSVTSAAGYSPIVITSSTYSPPTGSQVIVSGVPNPAANGTWTVTQTGSLTFSLNNSKGSVMFPLVGGGTWTWPGGAVTDATQDSPIVVTTTAQSPPTGSVVTIFGVLGNTAANGTWIVKNTGPYTFSLDGSQGSGSYLSGGTWISPGGGAVTGATINGDHPIVITSSTYSPPTGSVVTISGVMGNTAANGTWTVTNIDAATFSLDGSVGNAPYTGGGTWIVAGAPGGSSGDDQPPAPYAVEIAKQYADVLPGHPDSGKPITREFPTRAALSTYMQERNQAALRHYASVRQKPKI